VCAGSMTRATSRRTAARLARLARKEINTFADWLRSHKGSTCDPRYSLAMAATPFLHAQRPPRQRLSSNRVSGNYTRCGPAFASWLRLRRRRPLKQEHRFDHRDREAARHRVWRLVGCLIVQSPCEIRSNQSAPKSSASACEKRTDWPVNR